MATIQPAFPRNIGSRTAVQWLISSAASAIIHGWSGANFASVVGGEAFDVTEDGVTATITLANTDITAALIAAAINAGTGLGTPASVGTDGALVLTAATSIAVSGMSAAEFAKIGLPNLSRNRSLPASSAIQLPVAVAGTEVELVSNPVTVPAGANRVALWVSLAAVTGNDVGGDFALAWGNGTEGETIDSIVAAPGQAAISGTLVNDANNRPFGYQKAYNGVIQQIGSLDGATDCRVYEASVPPGATKLFVVALRGRNEDPAAAPPFTPPTLSAAVYFGAR